MSEALFQTLQTLSNIVGTSNDEIRVRQALRPLIEPHVNSLQIDAMGNLIAFKQGSGASSLRVLVTAHMDEVGFMVVGYTGDGCLRVETTGGINDHILPGLQVVVGKERLPGVFGVKPIHRVEGGADSVPDIHSLAVDIGAKSKEEAESAAPLGTPITFATQFREMGASLSGKAFDNRAGCTVLATLLQQSRPPFDLYGVFTVQEEVGLRGAYVAAYTVNPDVAIVLEGTLADDLPKEEKDVSSTTELGKGPAITVKDRSYTTPPWLLRHFIQTAEAEGIPYQLKQPGISGTESGAIHIARGGIPTITVATPCRYIHGPVALMRRSDLENTAKLVHAVLTRLTPEIIAVI
ncbi:MAG: M42 family peptidase [Anaerolineae bacterium]|nr:M42 family peptidase [Anaerolineae bacterium]